MMEILKLFGTGILSVIVLLLTRGLERDKDRRQEKDEILHLATEGLKERNPSKITAALDRLNNLQ